MTAKQPKEKRTSDIVYVAIREFLEKGFENASMEGIARQAGLSKGGLYHHVRSKEDLLLYVNVKLSEPIEEMRQRARREPSPRRALRTYIASYLEFWRVRRQELFFFFLCMALALRNAELGRLYEEQSKETIRFFDELLVRGVAAAELPPHDTRARAIVLMSALDGIIGYQMFDPDRAFAAAERAIETALLAPPPPHDRRDHLDGEGSS